MEEQEDTGCEGESEREEKGRNEVGWRKIKAREVTREGREEKRK